MYVGRGCPLAAGRTSAAAGRCRFAPAETRTFHRVRGIPSEPRRRRTRRRKQYAFIRTVIALRCVRQYAEARVESTYSESENTKTVNGKKQQLYAVSSGTPCDGKRGETSSNAVAHMTRAQTRTAAYVPRAETALARSPAAEIVRKTNRRSARIRRYE